MTDRPELIRPARPASVELAAAIMIVGGAIQLLLGLTTLPGLPPGGEAFAALALVLNVATIATGILIRAGTWWLIAVNFTAVAGYLDLLGAGASPLQLMLGMAEVVVVVILLARKPWFDALARWRARQAGANLARRD